MDRGALARTAGVSSSAIVLGLSVLSAPAEAADLGAADPEGAQELAEKYAPIVMLKAQEEPCDSDGEPYAPTTVDIVLGNPEVLLRQVGSNNPVVTRAPTAADLFGLGEGFFIDFPGTSLDPGCIYERDFDKYRGGGPAVVYAHIVQQADHPDQLVVQYWLYWYYNDWNNKHESDWEGIALLFDARTIDEALGEDPVRVGYAQHEGGERADWDSSRLDRDGNHPVVYSSAGSHASYFGSALYIGRSGSEGFGCDNTDGPSVRLEPEVVVLPDRVTDPQDPLAWLAYDGRWGERQNGPFNGPTGPAAKDRWLEPIDWFDDLRPGSVIIPAGDSQAAQVIHAFCGVVEWGSGVVIQTTTSSARLLVSLAVLVVVGGWLVRRTVWDRVASHPVCRRRRAGQIIRTGWTAYRDSPGLAFFGVIYIPAAFVVGLLSALATELPVLGDLVDLAGTRSGTGTVLALFAGGLAHLAAFVAVNAMVAVYLDREPNRPLSPVEAAREVWARRRDLLSGFVRATLIVLILLVSILGIPWGIRQLVRYQFLPAAVMLDRLDGPDSLDRSTQLVRGRWWHTALVLGVVNALIGLTGLVVALCLLVAVPAIPIWLFSGLVTLIYALVVPLAAVAVTLLYGDAVAGLEDHADADLMPA